MFVAEISKKTSNEVLPAESDSNVRLVRYERQVRCSLQVTLCDPYLSPLSVRYFNKGAI